MQVFAPPLNATTDIIDVFVQHIKYRAALSKNLGIYNKRGEWLGEWEVQISKGVFECVLIDFCDLFGIATG
jgi:hypothetical protein